MTLKHHQRTIVKALAVLGKKESFHGPTYGHLDHFTPNLPDRFQCTPIPPHQRLLQKRDTNIHKLLKAWRKLGKPDRESKTLALKIQRWWALIDTIKNPQTFRWPTDTCWPTVLQAALAADREDIAILACSNTQQIDLTRLREITPTAAKIQNLIRARHWPNLRVYGDPQSLDEVTLQSTANNTPLDDYQLSLRLRWGGPEQLQTPEAKTTKPGQECLNTAIALDSPLALATIWPKLPRENTKKIPELQASIITNLAWKCWDWLYTNHSEFQMSKKPIEVKLPNKKQITPHDYDTITHLVKNLETNQLNFSEQSAKILVKNFPTTTGIWNALTTHKYTITDTLADALFSAPPDLRLDVTNHATAFSWTAGVTLAAKPDITPPNQSIILQKTQRPTETNPPNHFDCLPTDPTLVDQFLSLNTATVEFHDFPNLPDTKHLSQTQINHILDRISQAEFKETTPSDLEYITELPDTRWLQTLIVRGIPLSDPNSLIQNLGKRITEIPDATIAKIWANTSENDIVESLNTCFADNNLAPHGDRILARCTGSVTPNYPHTPNPATTLAEHQDWTRLTQHCCLSGKLRPNMTTLTSLLKQDQCPLAKQILARWPDLQTTTIKTDDDEIAKKAITLGIPISNDPEHLIATLRAQPEQVSDFTRLQTLRACRKAILKNDSTPYNPATMLPLLVPIPPTNRTTHAYNQGTLHLEPHIGPNTGSLNEQITHIQQSIATLAKTTSELNDIEFCIRHQTGEYRWPILAHLPCPHPSLANQLPLGFNSTHYYALLRILKHHDVSYAPLKAFSLQVTYKSAWNALAAIKQTPFWKHNHEPWSKFANIVLPTHHAWNRKAWRRILGAHGHSGHTLLPFAPAIEEKLGHPPRHLCEAQGAADQIAYTNAAQAPGLARLANEKHLDPTTFETLLAIWPQHKNQDNCPNLRLSHQDLDVPDVTFEKIQPSDPLSLVIPYTFNRWPSHHHQLATTHPDVAFYVLRQHGNIIAYSLASRTKNTLIFHDWKTKDPISEDTWCHRTLRAAAPKLLNQKGITEVRFCGTRGQRVTFKKADQPTPLIEGIHNHEPQYCIAKLNSKKP